MKKIKVFIHLLRTEEGGRNNPIKSGYRPNFFFSGTRQSDGKVEFAIDELSPGHSISAEVELTCPELIKKVDDGEKFIIREGTTVVGNGYVTERDFLK